MVDIKGVRLTTDGLSDAARAYLGGKLKRERKRVTRDRALLGRLFHALLPRDFRRVEVETYVQGRGRVLVIGCGGGIETLALGAVGIDIEMPLLRVASEVRARAEPTFQAASFTAASGSQLPFRAESFDAILSDNVVEHIPGDALRRHFAETLRVLRSGGLYVLTSPNLAYEDPPKPGHVSLHTYAEWERLLSDAGYGRIETPRRRSGPLEGLEWKRRQERRPRAWGAGNRGLRMVTLISHKP
ncbi:MAG: class I SAM-dependent methyltransferase [Planctomycetes bacterium]|nr:class I SAM-dependent methyltransferase [Planctomycetota bacterium]